MPENFMLDPANILIIEEHPALRAALRDWLAFSFPDYQVNTSENYIDALNRIRGNFPEIVVVDFDMIGKNGLCAIERIKTYAPLCKIVILTLLADESNRSIFETAGVDARVLKQSLGTNLIPTMTALLE